MAFTQRDRLISICTSLGEDALLLTDLTGEEGISRSFNFELSLLSERHAIPLEALPGSNATVSIALANGSKRYLNGIISSFSHVRSSGEDVEDRRFSFYRCTLVSWFWTLSKCADIKIFQNRSTPEIVEQVFDTLGFSWYRFDLRGSYDKREFCVQYRETTFNFVSRLLEEEGLFYFFRHEDGKHTMIIADSPDANRPCPFQQHASSRPNATGTRHEDVITSLEITRHMHPAKYALNDYNFTIPNTSLKSEAPGAAQAEAAKCDIYDAPGCFGDKATGDRLAKIRMEEEETFATVLVGSSDCRAFASGYRFQLRDHCGPDLDGKEFLLVSVKHEAVEGYATDCVSSYQNSFKCIPHPTPYRAARLTPKPVVQGAQTAVVVGPPGEEIWTDRHGRVKVHFHWDRAGKRDDSCSCWIRVSHPWAGSGWGAFFVPRVGQEVVVEFLEGDPDRPIIIGQLYNGMNLPPYQLPEQKTRSCIKSFSTPERRGHNELRFEDKKGEEHLYLHAEREQVNLVKVDSLEWVGQDRHLVVDRDRLEKVSRDQHLQVAGDLHQKVGGDLSLSVGADVHLKVTTKYALQSGEDIHIQAAKSVVLESLTQVSLRVGGNFITVSPAGVTIVGNILTSGAPPASCLGASPEQPKPPKEAGKPGMDDMGAGKPEMPIQAGPQTKSFQRAAAEHNPLCER
ncbi:type VI secretion system tip protein VgrG [Geomonas nitrogeniifigens]|uniref:type VI secretion system Vgr family protein n=1 Tax=Geomonas diazotrophica TaxID=2843197 RepID=UPI001C2C8BFC|nr:type VI secretion system tip protein TssI/VgrG [Geomonas nitrogeniifigens]QXE87782.1 type VI secretion system tip protein VgrG [Geomonas nitrogeniifigens]